METFVALCPLLAGFISSLLSTWLVPFGYRTFIIFFLVILVYLLGFTSGSYKMHQYDLNKVQQIETATSIHKE